MRVTNVILTPKQISGNNGDGIFLNMTDNFEYLNNKRTQNIIGKKIEVVLPDNNYEKIFVKVGTLLNQTEEFINGVNIRFENLTGRFYRTDKGDYELSCSAKTVRIIKKEEFGKTLDEFDI